MALQGGMGDALYVDGLDLSGDIGSLSSIRCPLALQDTTSINLSAMRRLPLLRDGGIDFTSFWNPGAAADTAHTALKTLPTTDRSVQYCRGTTRGNPAASMVGKQIGYDGTRAADGSFLLNTAALANAYGLDWGSQLTAGKDTQVAAGNGTSIDQTTVSTAFGWAMYLQVFAFTGTSITLKVQDSANDSVWADLASATFTAASAVGSQRVSAGPTSTATVRRYVRYVSTGTFSSATFAINFVRYEAAGHQ